MALQDLTVRYPQSLARFLHSLLFVAAMVCHGTLAAERPPPARLTEFCLLMSVGGIFNAIVAPSLFSFVAEYPLILAAACLLAPAVVHGKRPGSAWRERAGDLVWPALLGVLCYWLILWTDCLSNRDKVARILLSVGMPAVLS